MATGATVPRVRVVPGDAHDGRLVGLVGPPDWVNPEPAPRYNLVVLGGGTAGLVCAAGAAGLGARVALVERELMGGDCLNVGCVPSKALLRAARAAAAVLRARDFGVGGIETAAVDFPAVMERLRRLRADLAPNDSARRFRSLGVDVFLGDGRFVGPDALEVGGKRLRFARAVIATGARAARPEVPGLDDAGYLTNESVFALTALPPRLCVLGAGPVGCELAQAFARLGAKVTLIDRNPRVLHREEASASDIVKAALEGDGVEVILEAQVQRVERTAEGKVIHLGGRAVTADEILVAAGRRPNLEGVGLEAAGVRFGAKGVEVNDFMRTSNPRVYAAGDVCSRYPFTHAADAMARIVIQNALFWGRARASALVIPWCTYTSPEVARVGLSQAEAREKGVAFDVISKPMREVDRAVLEGETEGFAEVLLKKGTDRIVGCTIVGEHAGELIAEASVAMARGMGLRQLGAAVRPYPTRAEVFRKLGDAYNRTRLTAWVAWALRAWLAWGR